MQFGSHDLQHNPEWYATHTPYSFLPRMGRAAEAAIQAPVPIAEMADLFGVTHRTLHFYEEKGLISAQRSGMMRMYDADSIRRMAVITACREIGISLSAIQDLMNELAETQSQDEAEECFRQALDIRKRELACDMSAIHRQIQQIRTMSGSADAPSASMRQVPELTDLESSCLRLMTEGYHGRQLAQRLEIDESELAEIEAGLIAKFGVANRFQAAAKAILLGMLTH